MKKFLVIQTAFIGDFILATPIASELKRIYPNSQIDFLVRKGNESILENNPHVSTCYVLNKKDGKFSSILSLIKIVRSNKYDEVINLHRFASSGLITIFSGAKSKVGFDKNPLSFLFSKKIKHEIGNGLHEVERNLACIKHHGAKKYATVEVFPDGSDFEKIEVYTSENYYCLAPASVWFTKQLPISKWVELASILLEKGKVFLIGGPNDVDLCDRIVKEINKENCQNLAGKFTFLQSAALFKNAAMNFVNDSGPMHFCSAVNAPVTAFFCSTIPAFGFGPLSENSQIIEIAEILNCRPCGLHGHKSCPKGHFKCGNNINIQSLF